VGRNQRDRLLVVGLDAADLNFIRSRQAQLPTFRKLLDTRLIFQPAAPKALSGSVWPSFYTGAHPGHHGIYQHLVWDAQRMGLRKIGPDWCWCRPFWADLEDRGRRVTVLDIPYSFPIFLKRGVEITDWGTHGQTRPLATNRRDVGEFLRKFGRSPIGRETPVKKTRAQLNSIHHTLLASVDRKCDLMLALMKEFEWDVFIGAFAELHRAGHMFFDEADALPGGSPETRLSEIYRAVDRALCRILEGVDLQKTTLVLFSLHGMMRDYGQGHLVKPVMERLNQIFLARHMGKNESTQRAGGLIGHLRRLVPSRVQYAVGEAAPDWVRQWVVEREIIGGIQWSRTPGFSLRTDIRAELRLNLVGRESKGLLETGSELCRAYQEFLKRAFLGLRDQETGDLLVDEVVEIPVLFPGERSHALPDFAITWRPLPLVRLATSPEIGSVESVPSGARGGDHTDFGFAAVSPSRAIQARLSATELPTVSNIWELGNLYMRLDELSATSAAYTSAA
jgi:predicted AlkP superfamily phosphohydrolase/phosphomutase